MEVVMTCKFCTNPPKHIVIFMKEMNAQTGYLSGMEDKTTFDSNTIEKFVFACAQLGKQIGNQGILDVCDGCKIQLKALMEGKTLLNI
jgi:hypothetical protein